MSLNHFRQYLAMDVLHRRKYDQDFGYDYVTAIAQRRSAHAVDADHPVVKQGYDVVRCLAPAEVPACIEQVIGADGQDAFRSLSLEAMTALLEQILSPAADAAIRAAFGSEYAVVFGGGSTTVPLTPDAKPEERYSFLWHCDGGPLLHLKLLVYLESAADHDGATAVIAPDASQRMALTGYNLCRLEDRVDDLTDLAAEAGVSLAPQRVVPRAGEALIFNPRLVLHKGIAPRFGQRRVLTIGVVPFPAPWQLTLPELLPFIRQSFTFEFPNLSRPAGA